MSLTSIISASNVRKKLLAEFPVIPLLKSRNKILAPSISRHPQLVGIAFDYILRFYIKRLNNSAYEQTWVADNAIELDLLPRRYKRKALKILTDAKIEYLKYIYSGRFNSLLFKSIFRLAQLEGVSRTGIVPDRLGFIDKNAIKDLKKLTRLLKTRLFKSKKHCVLNPTFGFASSMVGGADADLVIDNALIDIKVTKELKVSRYFFNQLIGYYTLSEIERSGDPDSYDYKIKKLGIYFARHGLLYTFSVSSVLNRAKLERVKKILKNQSRRPI